MATSANTKGQASSNSTATTSLASTASSSSSSSLQQNNVQNSSRPPHHLMCRHQLLTNKAGTSKSVCSDVSQCEDRQRSCKKHQRSGATEANTWDLPATIYLPDGEELYRYGASSATRTTDRGIRRRGPTRSDRLPIADSRRYALGDVLPPSSAPSAPSSSLQEQTEAPPPPWPWPWHSQHLTSDVGVCPPPNRTVAELTHSVSSSSLNSDIEARRNSSPTAHAVSTRVNSVPSSSAPVCKANSVRNLLCYSKDLFRNSVIKENSSTNVSPASVWPDAPAAHQPSI